MESHKLMCISKLECIQRLIDRPPLATQLPYLSDRLVCRIARFLSANRVARELEGIGARRENLVKDLDLF